LGTPKLPNFHFANVTGKLTANFHEEIRYFLFGTFTLEEYASVHNILDHARDFVTAGDVHDVSAETDALNMAFKPNIIMENLGRHGAAGQRFFRNR
jgi:hypothetical protein